MPNPRWNNQHGANDASGGGHREGTKGSAPSGSVSEKSTNWPGLPGPTQPKDRSAGQPKKGWKGEFQVKKVGI